MKNKKDFSLKPYNQFGVEAKAAYFAAPQTVDQLQDLLANQQLMDQEIVVLGEGNNTLFVGDFDGLIIKPEITGREVVEQSDKEVVVKIGVGENWNKIVSYVVENGWGGIENLIAIPGAVGGAVSQNIGAYGQEVGDVIKKVEAVNLDSGEKKVFDHDGCQFEYRTSIFKDELKNKYLITYVWFVFKPMSAGYTPNYEYQSLKEELQKLSDPPYSLSDVLQAVASQRSKNLPDINQYGTCGCFFTNPIVSKKKYRQIKEKLPDLPSYPSMKGTGWVKIPAGYLVDKRGWKGKWENNVGVSKKHALCLVTKREASGQEILELAKEIKKDVYDAYGVELDFEVNIV